MGDGQVFEQMPYVMWVINDIYSKECVKSHIFTVQSMKFRMVFRQVLYIDRNDQYEIYIEPAIEERETIVFPNSFKAKVSVMRIDKHLGDFIFCQKTEINLNGKDLELRRRLWHLGRLELFHDRAKVVDNSDGMNSVTFLCVFGLLGDYPMDNDGNVDVDAWWRKEHCLQRLAMDLDKQRLNTDSTILLKCGNKAIAAHELILSARSEELANMFRSDTYTNKEIEIKDMSFNVLENFITYIYSGKLKDTSPCLDLLMDMYKAAVKYKVKPLKRMTTFKLLNIIENAEWMCDYHIGDEELSDDSESGENELSNSQQIEDNAKSPDGLQIVNNEEFFSRLLNLLVTANEYNDAAFKERIFLYIIKRNLFLVKEAEWAKFRKNNPVLAMEFYDKCAEKVLYF